MKKKVSFDRTYPMTGLTPHYPSPNFTLVVKTYHIFNFFMPQFEVKVNDLTSPRVAVLLVMKNNFFEVILHRLEKTYRNVTNAIRRPKCLKARIKRKI